METPWSWRQLTRESYLLTREMMSCAKNHWNMRQGVSKIRKKITIRNYGRLEENKPFHLNNTIFASSGSLVRSPRAMQHIRERTFVILIHTPIERVLSNISKRPDGAGRIIGMNGWPHGEKPMHATLEEELRYRETLYQQSCDAVFLYRGWVSIDDLAKEFEKFVIQVIESSTLHSA
jgi:shikimate kinase